MFMNLKSVLVVVVALLAVSVAVAQEVTQPPPNPSTNAPSFTLSASVLSLPSGNQTSAATDIGGTFAVTPNLLLRSDNILAPAVNLSAYCGGLEYGLPAGKILAKTNLDPGHFQFYVTASGCQSRVTVGNTDPQVHFGYLGGGGVNYDPTGKGKFSINLAEVRYARLPGLSQNTVIVSSGLRLGF